MAENDEHGPLRLRIDGHDAGKPLYELVLQALGDAALAQAVLAHGGAWLGRERARDPDQLVPVGELLTISRPPTGSYAEPQIGPQQVCYEDADLIAIDKPAGTYVEATPWDAGGHLRAALETWLAQRDRRRPILHLAHRLDRDTSGVLLFSKNPALNAALHTSFAHHAARKRYLCRCAGEPAETSFTLESGHGRGAHGRFKVYPFEQIGERLPNGDVIKPMETRFTVLQREGDSSLLQAEPISGRTHQIRLHMAFCGHPLLGDTKYGGPTKWQGRPLAIHLLHAAELAIPHPCSGETLVIQAAAPAWAA